MATQATIRPPQAPRHGLGAVPQPPSRPKGAWGRNFPNTVPSAHHRFRATLEHRPLAPPTRAVHSRRPFALPARVARSRRPLAPQPALTGSTAPDPHGQPRLPNTVPSAHTPVYASSVRCCAVGSATRGERARAGRRASCEPGRLPRHSAALPVVACHTRDLPSPKAPSHAGVVPP